MIEDDVRRASLPAEGSRRSRSAASSGTHFYYEAVAEGISPRGPCALRGDGCGERTWEPGTLRTVQRRARRTSSGAVSEAKNHAALARRLDKMARDRLVASARIRESSSFGRPDARTESSRGSDGKTRSGGGGDGASGRGIGVVDDEDDCGGFQKVQARLGFRSQLGAAMAARGASPGVRRVPVNECDASPARPGPDATHAEAAHLNMSEGEEDDVERSATTVTSAAAAAAAAAAAEVMSLRRAVASLEDRAAALATREAYTQNRLAVFERMEPIFERVAEWQRFSGPEEVMERMDTLETMCADLISQLADAKDAAVEARERAEAAEARERAIRERSGDAERLRMTSASTHVEEREALRRELASVNEGLVASRTPPPPRPPV